jgi:RNA polymerase sigma factor (sigma-70 family)
MSPDDDGDLMSRLQSGDDHALDPLMARWQMPLRRFLFQYLHNEADSLDLAEETFVRIYQHRAKFRPGAKFSTWMFSIALNLCRDRGRWSKARPVILLDENALTRASDRALDPDGTSPDANLLRNETASAVRAAVDALPDPLKTAVLLCEYEELSQAEVAAITGCSVKAVETRLYRARQLLRDALRAQFV